MSGHTVKANIPPDLLEQLAARKLSDKEIGLLLKLSDQTVRKYRLRYSIPSQWERPKRQYPHGDRARYQAGCRCNRCAEAERAYKDAYRRRGPHRHGTLSAYQNYGCRCQSCKQAYFAHASLTENRKKAARASRQRNDTTREVATRARYVWTGPELELISRPDLTARECALRLGRSLAAVRFQRHLLKAGIPKKLRTRGLVGDDAPH